MAEQIEELTQKIPFTLKNVFTVFLLTVFSWLLVSFTLNAIIRISFGIKDIAYLKLFMKQPQTLSFYISIYCAIAGLLTWFLLIKKIKRGVAWFFNKATLRQDLVYGFELFIKSLGALMLFFMLLIFLFAVVSKAFGLDYELLKNIYFQGRDAEVQHLYAAYKFNALIIFLVVFFGPLYEEIFYRGCLYTVLRKRFSFLKSLIFSSLFFALIHGYVFNFFPVLLLGTILAYAYERRASLTAPLILHFCWNAFSALFIFLKI